MSYKERNVQTYTCEKAHNQSNIRKYIKLNVSL